MVIPNPADVPPTLKVCVPARLIPAAGEEATVAPVILQVSLVTAQLSAKVGLGKLIVAVQSPGVLLTVIFAGQVMVGACTSSTVTVKEQLAVPHELVAVAVTLVLPTGKKDPEAWLYVITGAGLPVAVAAG